MVLRQVFCSKQQPRCGTCPLRSMCEYALHKGPCMPAPLADAGNGSQPAAAAGPALAPDDALAGAATRGSGSTSGEEATESLAAVAERGTGVDSAVPDEAALAHAAPRVMLPTLTVADREAHVLRILAAAVEPQPEGSKQSPSAEPADLALDSDRQDHVLHTDINSSCPLRSRTAGLRMLHCGVRRGSRCIERYACLRRRRLQSYLEMMELRTEPCSECSLAEVAAPSDVALQGAAAVPDASIAAEVTGCCCQGAPELSGSPSSCSGCRQPQDLCDWLQPAAVRRRYRELSMAVHPDKCNHPLADKVHAVPDLGCKPR